MEEIKHKAIKYAIDKNGVFDTHIYRAYLDGYREALEVLRKEAERRKIIYDDAEHEPPYESVTPRQVYNARKSCMGEIILFIDRLSK